MFPVINSTIYLDNNATTRLIPEVKEILHEIINTSFGNPSSPHSYSDFSRKIIQNSREYIAQFIHCVPDQLVFTSGASESNSMLMQSLLYSFNKEAVIITTPFEHSSIKENCHFLNFHGIEVKVININRDGLIELNELNELINEYNPSLISIGWASNETGVIQPIEDISKICKDNGVLFHTDASQYIGRGKIDLTSLNIDFLSFTGHKLHAPQGVGCLFIKNPNSIVSYIRGGEQEHGLRAGTENVIGIAGIGKAIETRMDNLEKSIEKMKDLRDNFELSIISMIPDVYINGEKSQRTPNTSNITFLGIDGRALLAQLDIAGVICSQTSACTSMIPAPSETLRAMGLTVDEAFSSLRFSFAVDNTTEEVESACILIKEKVETIRKFYSLRGSL